MKLFHYFSVQDKIKLFRIYLFREFDTLTMRILCHSFYYPGDDNLEQLLN